MEERNREDFAGRYGNGSVYVKETCKIVQENWWRFCRFRIILILSKTGRIEEMRLGNHLFHARKKCGLSQEEVAAKLGVSRQTISKWETDETLPDIRQSKQMALLYHVSLDELIEFDIEVKEIEEMIERTSEEVQEKIDWTSAWGRNTRFLLPIRMK